MNNARQGPFITELGHFKNIWCSQYISKENKKKIWGMSSVYWSDLISSIEDCRDMLNMLSSHPECREQFLSKLHDCKFWSDDYNWRTKLDLFTTQVWAQVPENQLKFIQPRKLTKLSCSMLSCCYRSLCGRPKHQEKFVEFLQITKLIFEIATTVDEFNSIFSIISDNDAKKICQEYCEEFFNYYDILYKQQDSFMKRSRLPCTREDLTKPDKVKSVFLAIKKHALENNSSRTATVSRLLDKKRQGSLSDEMIKKKIHCEAFSKSSFFKTATVDNQTFLFASSLEKYYFNRR